MDGFASFPHSVSMRNHPKARMLEALMSGTLTPNECYGALCRLLELLYQTHNRVDVSTEVGLSLLASELCIEPGVLPEYISALAKAGWIDADPLGNGVVSSHNVQEQIDYCAMKSEAGKKGGRPRKSTSKSTQKTTC